MAKRQRSDGTTAGGEAIQGTSIFDPTLCELLVRWFSGDGAKVLDPFAGGSVRGIVSAMLGRHYVGVDLREEQIEANRIQAETILLDAPGSAEWYVGDSRKVLLDLEDIGADFVMTCPPYAWLERYSDDPRDISTMGYADFMAAFEEIMRRSVSHMREDRFCAIVIGDVRDKDGCYLGLPADTIVMMRRLGLKLYNELVLVTPAGSLPGRTRLGFTRSRKAGRTHQVALIFVLGDPKAATAACGECEFGALDPFAGAADAVEPQSNPLEGLGEIL